MKGIGISEFIKSVPKVELHIHAEAIVSIETYHSLNLKNNVEPEYRSLDDYNALLDIKSLKDMIGNFLFLQTFFTEASDYLLLCRDVGLYCERNNIKYIELHVSPSMVMRAGHVNYTDFMNTLVKGLEDLEASGKVVPRIIIDLSRTFGVENAQNNLENLLSYLEQNPTRMIVGVGLGGQESGNPVNDYKSVFDNARAAGLRIVAHAGEEVGPESIWQAVRDAGAERIGHGTSAITDSELMDYLRDKKIPLEVCPTSNIVTGKYVTEYKGHPIKHFIERGLCVTVNTDDPVLFNIELNREYEKLAEAFGYGHETIIKLVENSIKASFMDDAQKEAFLKNFHDTVETIIKG